MNIRVDSPYGEHYIVDTANAPDDDEGEHVWSVMSRVREWDRIYAAGWIALPNGYKRSRVITYDD